MPPTPFNRRSFGRLAAGAVFVGLAASACATSNDKTATAAAAGTDAAASR